MQLDDIVQRVAQEHRLGLDRMRPKDSVDETSESQSREGLTDPKEIELVGWNHLAGCFDGDPPELVERLRLKCPPELSLQFSAGSSEEQREKKAKLAMKILLAEVAPDHSSDWHSLGVSILHRLIIDTVLDQQDLPTRPWRCLSPWLLRQVRCV